MNRRFSLKEYFKAANQVGVSWKIVALLLAIELGSVAFEIGGVAMLLPVFQFMSEGGNPAALIETQPHWKYLAEAHSAIGLDITLGTLLGASLFLILLRQIMTFARTIFRVAVRQRLAHQLRGRVFGAFINARYDYQRDTKKGALINDLTIELPRAVSAVFDTALVLGHLMLIGAYTAGLFYLSVDITLLTLFIVGSSAVLLKRIMARTQNTSSEITEANRSFGGFLSQRIRATRLIRLSGAENREHASLEQLSETCRNRTVHLSKLQALTQLIVEPTVVLVVFTIIYVGYTYGGMAAETLGIFAIALARLLPVIRSAIADFQTVLGQWASLQAVLSRFHDIDNLGRADLKGDQVPDLLEEIRFDHVSYRYPGRNEHALNNVSLRIPKGSTVAIVGPSGSGKSTLIDLIPRLIEPSEGQILFDDTPLSKLDPTELRSTIAFVGQQAEILDATPREHIVYGAVNTSEESLHHAARLAGADGFIGSLPQGYDTPLGESGSSLSGGQRQRLDIARALMRGASLLILDEPTSQLDAQALADLRNALKRIQRETDTTILIVSHALDLAQDADTIVVLDRGNVAEAGSAASLMERKGWFAKATTGTKDNLAPRAAE